MIVFSEASVGILYFLVVSATLCDQSLRSHRTVICHDDHFVGGGRQFVVEDDQVFVTCSEYSDHAVAGALECLRDRQHRRSPHATAGTNDCSVVLDACSLPERANNVSKAVARVQGAEFGTADTNTLYDQSDRAGSGVGIGNGERHTLGEETLRNDPVHVCKKNVRCGLLSMSAAVFVRSISARCP